MNAQSKFLFLGNHPLLDFVNTRISVKGEPVDLLSSFEDYIDWLVEASLIPVSKHNEIGLHWRDEVEKNQVLEKVRAFRSNLHRLVTDLTEEKNPSTAILEEINYFLAFNSGGYQLTQRQGRIEKLFAYGFKAPVHFLVPVAVAAMQLLTETEYSRIRKCETPACVLVFYDTSKSRRRRWCSMKTCGNRMKVNEFLKRRRK
jgi:predicted RNA-binding Zn ribbon-like protein